MSAPKYVTFQEYAGFRVSGDQPVEPPKGKAATLHMRRAFFLTTQVEAPRWGTVQSYDGAGMSAGPLHCVAVLPNQSGLPQGALWPLVRHIQSVVGLACEPMARLVDALRVGGWVVASDGKLRRSAPDAAIVSGEEIRAVFTPPAGKVPPSGTSHEIAKQWAQRFADLFGDPSTFHAQEEHAIAWLSNSHAALEHRVYSALFPFAVQYPENLRVSVEVEGFEEGLLPRAVDLAMCVYHAHSVNAPGIAKGCLETVLANTSAESPHFPGRLVRALGRKKFGKWQDMPGEVGANRYDRTRLAAMKSGLWPGDYFRAGGIMPKDLLD